MCAAFGYEAEEHILQTKDGYLLCLHRICRKKGEPYPSVGSNRRDRIVRKPVVYLHHGLLMNSEVWVCQIDEKLSLPFRLVEEGYDVWFGNNRGNKYSRKSLNHLASKAEFWNFSMVYCLHCTYWHVGRICFLRHSRFDWLYPSYHADSESELHWIQSGHRTSFRRFVYSSTVEWKGWLIHCTRTCHESKRFTCT